jgi:hypothetical protein
MSLNIEATWSRPIALRLAKIGAIYECEELESIPSGGGVYIFGREHGDSNAPLYIGKALNLRRQIEQQLNSVRLMKGIQEAQIGGRFLIYCMPTLRRGQKIIRVISILEQALIAHALSEDFELYKNKGQRRPTTR